jgi:hypothetical protein
MREYSLAHALLGSGNCLYSCQSVGKMLTVDTVCAGAACRRPHHVLRELPFPWYARADIDSSVCHAKHETGMILLSSSQSA